MIFFSQGKTGVGKNLHIQAYKFSKEQIAGGNSVLQVNNYGGQGNMQKRDRKYRSLDLPHKKKGSKIVCSI